MEQGTLTRKANFILSEFKSEFNSLYYKGNFNRKIAELEKAQGKSNYLSLLVDLYDMLSSCDIKYEKNKDLSYYKKLIENSNIGNSYDLEKRMVNSLYSQYKKYPTPHNYMLRIVNRLSTDDAWNNDTLRVRILKQFIKYTNYLKGASYHGDTYIKQYAKLNGANTKELNDILNSIDDNIFLCLKDATKEQKKSNGKFGLLKMADDLAQGKFRSFGSTKKTLYYFAIAYNMSFCLNENDEMNYLNDIEKNLFIDYYSNNLMRFISNDYKQKLCEFEIDPSGQGINYNNFAEMIYLYYLASDYSAEEKIQLSEQMIDRLKKANYKNPINQNKKNSKSVAFCEDVFLKDEEEFEKYITTNYDCNTFSFDTNSSISVMQLGINQKNAFNCYLDIIDMLKFELEKNIHNYCDYGLWFPNEKLLKQMEVDNEFKELLRAVSKFVGSLSDIINVKSQILYETFTINEQTITRTALVVAYYYYYMHLCDAGYGDKFGSFEELYNDFKEGIDEYLIAANYQCLNSKNIFDTILVFAIYDSII